MAKQLLDHGQGDPLVQGMVAAGGRIACTPKVLQSRGDEDV
ncbi:MAG: hypothetical protein ACLQFR_08065 [Streptosporangiaceae bacterium]